MTATVQFITGERDERAHGAERGAALQADARRCSRSAGATGDRARRRAPRRRDAPARRSGAAQAATASAAQRRRAGAGRAVGTLWYARRDREAARRRACAPASRDGQKTEVTGTGSQRRHAGRSSASTPTAAATATPAARDHAIRSSRSAAPGGGRGGSCGLITTSHRCQTHPVIQISTA